MEGKKLIQTVVALVEDIKALKRREKVRPLPKAGPAGLQGEAGDVGQTGGEGPTGRDGRDGETGQHGGQGEPGAPGITGAEGPTGRIGETGEAGDIGAQGEVGQTGPQGATGPAGPTGEPGEDGTSVTRVQLEKGNTLAVWLDGVKHIVGKIELPKSIGSFTPGATGGSGRGKSTEFKMEVIRPDETTFAQQGKQIIECNNTAPATVTLNVSPFHGEQVHIKRRGAVVTVIGQVDGLTDPTIDIVYDAPFLVFSKFAAEWMII